MQGIKDGKIASTKIDGVVFTVNIQPAGGKPDKLTGNLADIAGYDIDTNAVAAIFDPQKSNDDQYYRAYRQITTGPYVVTSGQGAPGQSLNMRIDGMTIDDVGLRPSRMQLPDLLAMIPPPGAAPPTPAQARAMLEKVARVYEGIRIGNAEMRGLSVETPEGPIKLSAMRFNLDSGKVSEFAVEGLDGRTPQGPVKVGRFALKSLDIANLMRVSALFSNPAQPPSPDQALAMIPLIEGVELKGLVAPFKNTGKPVNIDTFNLDWGQFIGPIPSKVRLAAEDGSPARCERSRPDAAGRGRPRQGGHRPRFRRGLDGGVTRIRARAGDARPRRRREGIGAGVARQRAARGIHVQRGAGGGHGRANRGRTRSNSRCAIPAASILRSRNRPASRTSAATPPGAPSSRASGPAANKRRPPIPMPRRPSRRWPALSRPRARR